MGMTKSLVFCVPDEGLSAIEGSPLCGISRICRRSLPVCITVPGKPTHGREHNQTLQLSQHLSEHGNYLFTANTKQTRKAAISVGQGGQARSWQPNLTSILEHQEAGLFRFSKHLHCVRSDAIFSRGRFSFL